VAPAGSLARAADIPDRAVVGIAPDQGSVEMASVDSLVRATDIPGKVVVGIAPDQRSVELASAGCFPYVVSPLDR